MTDWKFLKTRYNQHCTFTEISQLDPASITHVPPYNSQNNTVVQALKWKVMFFFLGRRHVAQAGFNLTM